MSSSDVKIADYEQEKKEHRAEIQKIKSHKDYDMAADKWIAMIKSKEDAIHDCMEQLKLLRQQQMPGK